MSFPTTTSSFNTAIGTEVLNLLGGGTGLAPMLNNLGIELVSVENKIGTGTSTPIANAVLVGNSVGTSIWSSTLAGLTLTTPTIASFTNATHDHSNATGGGKLTSTGITSLNWSQTTVANPYKFRASRNSAANTGNGAFAVVAFDTEQFDTNNNLSSGVYTAPVNGFYQFNAAINTTTSGSEVTLVSLFKNGSEYSRGNQLATTTQTVGCVVSDIIPLTSGDTVDVRAFNTAARGLNVGNITNNYFSGYLVSQT